jgi:hypothetical protein
MRLTIRARNDTEVACLMADLARHRPERMGRTVVIELGPAAHSDLLAVLSAAERCLEANDIPSVKVQIDGKGYLMTSSAG